MSGKQPSSDNKNHQNRSPAPAGLEGLGAEYEADLAPATALDRLRGLPRDARRPGDLLRLQRAVGNRAVQRLLAQNAAPANGAETATPPAAAPVSAAPEHIQRDDPEPVENIDASMFTVGGGTLQHTGNVTAGPKDGNSVSQVTIEAPQVTFDATVEKHDDAVLGEGQIVQAGPVQTLNSSRRTGIYHFGGDPNMPEVTRSNQTVGTVRDAQWREGESGLEAAVPEPWYSQPSNLSDSHDTANVRFLDQPGFDLPTSIGQGILTSIEGEESFTTSLAVKKGEQLVHLKNQNWSIDWNMGVDAFGQGAGAEVTSGASTTAPSQTTGPIAVQVVRSWLGFPTVEAAMGVSTQTLLRNLIPAKQNDQNSYNNIVEALRRKNPRITIWLTVESTAEALGADEIEVTLTGHRSSTRGPVTLNDNEWDTFRFNLLDIVDPGAIESDGFGITISARDVGFLSHDAATRIWHYPFANATNRSFSMRGGGGGTYSVMAEMTG